LESKLLKAIKVLEEAGFRVDRAIEEDARDAGYEVIGSDRLSKLKTLDEKTGAIVIRCTPVKD
jgi:hypothetical protein